jgi:hypothetical protein
MAFNIGEIKSQLTFGGARASLFQVQITNPVNAIGDLKTPFMVQTAIIPESTLGTIEVPYFGRKIKIAGDRTFEPWTVTIINDEDFLIRNAMEDWMSSINSHEGNLRTLGSAASSEYKSQATVTQYSKTGLPLRVYNFNGIFPSAIASIPLDWSTVDDVERFDVTFSYDWWNVDGGSTGDGGTNN